LPNGDTYEHILQALQKGRSVRLGGGEGMEGGRGSGAGVVILVIARWRNGHARNRKKEEEGSRKKGGKRESRNVYAC